MSNFFTNIFSPNNSLISKSGVCGRGNLSRSLILDWDGTWKFSFGSMRNETTEISKEITFRVADECRSSLISVGLEIFPRFPQVRKEVLEIQVRPIVTYQAFGNCRNRSFEIRASALFGRCRIILKDPLSVGSKSCENAINYILKIITKQLN